MNARFSNMHKAFKFVDLDGSGKLSQPEIERALSLWGVPEPADGFGALFAKPNGPQIDPEPSLPRQTRKGTV